ncbi:MAG: hypothetical protein GY815_03060 [Gammaproteobacteria bacterium]|nr:hypothetical protein [Gammaproteobacteria bacterium]
MKKLLEDLRLKEVNVEGKGSCWILSVLASVAGLLQNPHHPKLLDRHIEYECRKLVWREMINYMENHWGALDDTSSKMYLNLLDNLHLVPPKGKGKGFDVWGDAGMDAWSGTRAYLFLARQDCMLRLCSLPFSFIPPFHLCFSPSFFLLSHALLI